MKRHSGFCEQSRKDSSVACTCGSVEQPAQAEPITQAMKTAIAYGKLTHPEAGPVEGISAEQFYSTNRRTKLPHEMFDFGTTKGIFAFAEAFSAQQNWELREERDALKAVLAETRKDFETIERIAERGGLSPAEAWFVLSDCNWEVGTDWKHYDELGRRWLNEINQRYEQHAQHLKHIQRFLLSMYQTMVDPVEEFQGNIGQLCELLLKRAVEERQAMQDLHDRVAELAEGMKTGIRTCTEANVRRVRVEQVLQTVAITHNSTEMWSQCRLCHAVSKLDGKTMRETLTHKPDCILNGNGKGPDPMRDTLQALVDRLEQVFSSDDYKSIFGLAFAHGVNYHGPSCAVELAKAKELLNGRSTTPAPASAEKA